MRSAPGISSSGFRYVPIRLPVDPETVYTRIRPWSSLGTEFYRKYIYPCFGHLVCRRQCRSPRALIRDQSACTLYTVPWTYRDPESYENYASIDFEVTQPFGLQFYISYSLILLYSLRLIYIKTKARFCIIQVNMSI